MTKEQVIELLKSPVKPDLEGAKKFALDGGYIGVATPKNITHWAHAGSSTAGLSMIKRKFHPERTKENREAFYRRAWGEIKIDNVAVDRAMKKAGVEEWQSQLKKGNPLKELPWDAFQGYVEDHLGTNTSDPSISEYDAQNHTWRGDTVWPQKGDSGVNHNFIEALVRGNATAKNLSDFGYQNVLVIENTTVVFVKLPKQTHFVSRTPDRNSTQAYELSNLNGPARVTSTGTKLYYYNGVDFRNHIPSVSGDKVAKTPKEIYETYIKDGKLTATVQEVLQMKSGQYSQNGLQTAFLKGFTSKQIQEAFSPKEALKKIEGRNLLTLLKGYDSDTITNGLSIKEILKYDSSQAQEILLKHFSSEAIQAVFTPKEALKQVKGNSLLTILKGYSDEVIKKEISVVTVLKHDNAEVRRVLMSKFDPEAILEACDARLLSKQVDTLPCGCPECKGLVSPDPTTNELFSVDIGLGSDYRKGNLKMGDKNEEWGSHESRAKMLKYTCTSTDRVYAKFVPFDIETANQGQAWSHHFTLDEYENELAEQS